MTKKFITSASVKRTPVSILKVRGQETPNEFPNNLSQHQWHHDVPDDPDRDLELVRRARLGDPKAKAELVRDYHRVVIGCAGKHWRVNYQSFRRGREHTNGARDDQIGRGFLTLLESRSQPRPRQTRCIRALPDPLHQRPDFKRGQRFHQARIDRRDESRALVILASERNAAGISCCIQKEWSRYLPARSCHGNSAVQGPMQLAHL